MNSIPFISTDKYQLQITYPTKEITFYKNYILNPDTVVINNEKHIDSNTITKWETITLKKLKKIVDYLEKNKTPATTFKEKFERSIFELSSPKYEIYTYRHPISDPGKFTTMWGYVIDYQVEGETGKFWIMSLASNSPLKSLVDRIFELTEIKG